MSSKKMSNFDTFFFAFNHGLRAAKAARDICAVYADGATAERSVRDWYAKQKKEILTSKTHHVLAVLLSSMKGD